MVGMCLSYAVLGVCFYVIETNMASQSQEELTTSYVFPHGWVPPLTIIILLFLGIRLIFVSKYCLKTLIFKVTEVTAPWCGLWWPRCCRLG